MKASPTDKIFTLEELIPLRESWKNDGKKFVFTNGCFDIIHPGHIDLLVKAAALGDILLVAVNSDASVRVLKGSNRPIQNEEGRMMIMASFSFVDAVLLFQEETPYRIIEALEPDILVKGGDYEKDHIVGADILKRIGGKVEIIPFLEGNSTSLIEQKIAGK